MVCGLEFDSCYQLRGYIPSFYVFITVNNNPAVEHSAFIKTDYALCISFQYHKSLIK